MKRVFHKLLWAVISLFLLVASPVQAQHWLGHANSSFAGTNGMYLNPATMACNRYNFYVNLTGLSVNVYNDYLKLNMPYSPWSALFGNVPNQYKDANGNPIFDDNYLAENRDGRTKNVSVMTELRGPSFLAGIGKRHTVAFGTRMRAGVQLLDMNEELARIIRWGTNPTDPAFSGPDSLDYNVLYNQNDFAMNANVFMEYSFSYAGVIMDNGPHTIKGGATVKRLTGLLSAYFKNSPGGGVIVYQEDSMGFINSSISYGYVNENYFTDKNNPPTLSRMLFKDKLGTGWGFDLGFTYEYKPGHEEHNYTMDGIKRYDRQNTKHKYRVAVAITDIGNINYNNSKWVRQRELPANTTRQIGSMDTLKKMFDELGQEAENINGFDRVDNTVGILAGGFQSATNSFRSKLPTTLNLQFDYNIIGNLYANVTYVQSLRKKGDVTMRHFNQLSVTPRYESKWFEAAVPLVINNDFRYVNFGMFFKFGPFFIGSDRVGSLLFNSRNLYAMDFYTGITLPFFTYKRPKDRDKDRVSDKYDLCPDSTGSVSLKGCPDRDGDKVGDAEDVCPDVAGERRLGGCPDMDKDGIADFYDSCPEVAGSKKTNGCPDTDNDGLLDNEDECPQEKGLATLKGCPDRDKDGIADKLDKCPDVKGVKQYNGCPKPEPKDTVVAKKTPKEVPKTAPKTELEKEDQVVQEVFDNLQFGVGSAVIIEESHTSIDKLAALLKQKKSYLLSIEGHTDNLGDKKANLKLSKQRAEAVKKYLVAKGISADRIFTEGYGDSRPLGSNTTEAGRKKNRRVEFMIMRLGD